MRTLILIAGLILTLTYGLTQTAYAWCSTTCSGNSCITHCYSDRPA